MELDNAGNEKSKVSFSLCYHLIFCKSTEQSANLIFCLIVCILITNESL